MKVTSYFVSVALLLSILHISSAQTVNVQGYVKDSSSKESLVNATVSIEGRDDKLSTNKFGFYTLTLPSSSEVKVYFSYIGYKPLVIPIAVTRDTTINVYLSTDTLLLKGITIESMEQPPNGNFYKLNVQDIKNYPGFMGEADLMKAFRFSPGVQTGKEGNSGIYVRGGSPDQNLVLLDDVPLYYIYHMGGLFSVFDPNSIKSMELIKGGFPAQYGGRLSSVIDVRLKDGDKNKKHQVIDIGLLSTRYSLETPVKKDTSSLLLSVRRCNLDLISGVSSFLASGGKFRAGYTFYDINMKYHQRISQNDQFSVSFYGGIDRIFVRQKDSEVAEKKELQIRSKTLTDWGNLVGALKWNHSFRSGMFNTLTVAFTKFAYRNEVEGKMTQKANDDIVQYRNTEFNSGLSDIIVKNDLDHVIGEHNLKFGFTGSYHAFKPGNLSAKQSGFSDEPTDKVIRSPSPQAIEVASYFEDTFSPVNNLNLDLGFHGVLYAVKSKSYLSFQPRASFALKLTEKVTANATLAKMTQFIHLLSNSGAGFPVDLWVPVTDRTRPQDSWLTSLGVNFLLGKRSAISIESDVFYKRLKHLIEFKEGASFFSGEGKTWEDNIATNGFGRAFGLEILLKKHTGRITGSFAYT
jgi:hypothetical protein